MSFLFLILLSLFPYLSTVQWLTPTEHDFGLIPQHQPIEHVFRFRNISTAPITIDNVRPNCGCTTPDWTFDAIAAGDTSAIRVVFDARHPGYFRKKVRVFFSNERKGHILYLEGEVE